jgi:glycine/D-amino acid oxidase-like deaminating enzyme
MWGLRDEVVVGNYDVAVCGGGPSGCSAALAARREGLTVILIEGQAQFGGMATSGLVSHWLGGRTQQGEWVIGGIFKELTEEASMRGCAIIPRLMEGRTYQPHAWLPWFIHGIPLDPFAMARFLDEKLTGAGVDVLLETQVLDCIVQNGSIRRLIVHNKSGVQAIRVSAVIDASGDADVAAMSGCDVQIGRESDGLMTPVSLSFHLYNVDHQELGDYIEVHKTPKFREKIDELRRIGEWPFPYEIFITVQLVQDDVAMVNTMRLPGVNGIDGRSRTKGLIQGRKEAYELLTIFRKHFPGFQKAEMKAIAPLLGVRETRRIKGDFCLSVKHLTDAAEFADTIGFSIYGWDLPDPLKPSFQPLVDESGGKFFNKVEKALSTPIPYRIMVPRPVTNLLCPGRAVSVERDVLGPLRVMAPCMAMGQACGVAAGQMVNHRISAASVDAVKLREKLRSAGCIVDSCFLPEISPRIDP